MLSSPSSHTSSSFELVRDGHLWRGRFVAMASPCEVLCETECEQAAHGATAFAAAEAWRIERKFSRYRTDSVVHAINKCGGQPIELDDETVRLVTFGAELWSLSEGRFDLTSGVLRHAWRFGEGGAAKPDADRIAALLQKVGWQKAVWVAPTLTLPDGMELDFGGIGKEYAVDRVAEHIAHSHTMPVLVNFGGDLRCVGPPPRGGAWHVGIESTTERDTAAAVVTLRSGALATSGDTRRYIEIDGVRHGHVLDARTGWPAPHAPRSITVAAVSCTQAGSYSTLAMLAGAGAEQFLDGEGITYWCLR
jgi:FAD:protein FMN transferase